jgi:hypothetical protein
VNIIVRPAQDAQIAGAPGRLELDTDVFRFVVPLELACDPEKRGIAASNFNIAGPNPDVDLAAVLKFSFECPFAGTGHLAVHRQGAGQQAQPYPGM